MQTKIFTVLRAFRPFANCGRSRLPSVSFQKDRGPENCPQRPSADGSRSHGRSPENARLRVLPPLAILSAQRKAPISEKARAFPYGFGTCRRTDCLQRSARYPPVRAPLPDVFPDQLLDGRLDLFDKI